MSTGMAARVKFIPGGRDDRKNSTEVSTIFYQLIFASSFCPSDLTGAYPDFYKMCPERIMWPAAKKKFARINLRSLISYLFDFNEYTSIHYATSTSRDLSRCIYIYIYISVKILTLIYLCVITYINNIANSFKTNDLISHLPKNSIKIMCYQYKLRNVELSYSLVIP